MAPRPPQNFNELRQRYSEIISGGHQKRFGVRSLRILKAMLDSPAEAAVKSISQIAREQGTDTSTVTRLAQRLGFTGFPGYQQVFRQYLKEKSSFYSTQVKSFLESTKSTGDSSDSALQQVAQEEWGNVIATLEKYDKAKFRNVIDLLLTAKRVSILGLRSVFPLAFYLAYYLRLVRDNVMVLGKSGHTLAEDLSLLRKGDLLVAISIRPYTKDTIIACQEAKRQGAELVTITDSLSSPLALETESTLIASSEGPYFFTPLTTLVIYAETLLSEVVKALGTEAISKLKHVEKLFERMDIETENDLPYPRL